MPSKAIRLAKRVELDLTPVARDVAGDYLAAVRGICRAAPACAAVMVAEIRDDEDMLDAFRAGAIG